MFTVGRRVRELGIRAALGAGPARVAWTAVRAAAPQVGVGVAVGLALAALVAPLLGTIFMGYDPGDAVAYGAVAVILVLTGVLAAATPARRAVAADVAQVLRADGPEESARTPASGLAQSITSMLYKSMVMMTPDADLLDATFFALADPTRRAILARLATGEASVGELAEPFEMSQPAISKHLKVLERAGLVSVDQDGTRRLRRLETTPLDAATEWIARYRDLWESQFRRLDTVLDELKAARRSD